MSLRKARGRVVKQHKITSFSDKTKDFYNGWCGDGNTFNAYRGYWNNITVMDTSAARAQHWWPQLINYLVLGIYSATMGVYRYTGAIPNDGTIIKEWDTVTIIFFLLTALIWLVNFTARTKRLYDHDHNSWWILLYSLPSIGTLMIFITLISPNKSHVRWPVNRSEI